MREKELFENLASQGIRIFCLELGTFRMTYIHPQKTTQEWRSDVRGIIADINTLNKTDGCLDDGAYNELIRRMAEAGYLEVADLAADTYEGRVVVHSASIVDDPIHREQADGFGHHGWESGIDESAITDEPHQRERCKVGKGTFPKDFWKEKDWPVDKDGYCLAALLEERENGR